MCWLALELFEHLPQATHFHIRGPWGRQGGEDIMVPRHFITRDSFHYLFPFIIPTFCFEMFCVSNKLYLVRNNLFVLLFCELTHQSWLVLLVSIPDPQR